MTLEKEEELDLKKAQKIFGYFDKSQLIELFKLILEANEKKVINIYRKIYDQGVDPKVFINDFLELVYYFKNINLLTLEGTNFSLNDEEYSKIKEIADKVNSEVLVLFWQFTIKTLEELELVSNQNLSIEMFLMRLMHLKSAKLKHDNQNEDILLEPKDKSFEKKNLMSDNNVDTIDQIKNISQAKKNKFETQAELKIEAKTLINSFDDLLKLCTEKKEIKLKYEIEKNVHLVRFEKNRIEISFNDNLDKNFVKDLSLKLLNGPVIDG